MATKQTGMTQGVKVFFGIFMVLVYLGMAVLMATNFFNWSETPLWNGVRWFFAAVFALYGIYRGYREIKGEHMYGMRTYEEQDDEDQYMTYADRLKEIEKNNDNDEKK